MQTITYRYNDFIFYKWQVDADEDGVGRMFFRTATNIFQRGGSGGVVNLGLSTKWPYDIIEVDLHKIWTIDITNHRLQEILHWFYEEEVFSKLIFIDSCEDLSVRLEKVEDKLKMHVIEWDDTNPRVLLKRMKNIEEMIREENGY